MRRLIAVAFVGVLFLCCSVCHAQKYLAFSLEKAKKLILSLRDKGQLPPEIYYLGNITNIKGFVYNKKKKELIIVGVNEPDSPPITLDDLCIALRSVLVYGKYPYLQLSPDKEKGILDVYMNEGIKNTLLGKELLNIGLSVQQTLKGRKGSQIFFVSVIPKVERTKDAAVIHGFELRVLSGDKKTELWNKKDHVFLKLRSISQLIALFQTWEQMDINGTDVWFWLKRYELPSVSTPDRINSSSDLALGIKVLGAAFFDKKKRVKKLKKEALKNIPKNNRVIWSFELKKEKDVFIDKRQDEAIKLLSRAVMLTDLKKSYYEALDLYTRMTRMFPKWGLVYYLRGCVRDELGHYQDAIKDYERAIKLNSRYPMAYVNKGYSYNYLGMHKKALKELNKAVKLSPYHIDAYNNRGIAFCGMGKYQKVIADFENVIRIVPDFSLAYVNLGKAYFCLGEYKKAIAKLNKAIKLSPSLAEAYCNRGIAYRYMGEYKEALKDFNKAIQIKPYYAYAYLQRGLTYEDLCEWKKADRDIEKAVKLDPSIFSVYIMGVIRLNPRTAVEYHERGHAYFCMGQWKKAIADFNKAISMRPGFASAYFYRGLSYDNLKDYKKAIQDYSKAINLFPKDAIMYNNRGTAYYSCKEYKKALMDFNKAIELDPQKPVFYENRVRVYSRLGRNKEACEDAKHACQLGRCRLYRILTEKGICK